MEPSATNMYCEGDNLIVRIAEGALVNPRNDEESLDGAEDMDTTTGEGVFGRDLGSPGTEGAPAGPHSAHGPE